MLRETAAGLTVSPWPKQWRLIDCGAQIAIYGGSAGGGKSAALLFEPICRGLHLVPGFTYVIFRREGKEITDPGGLWDKACAVYPYVDGTAHVGEREFRWESGAKISFRHVENEADKHKFAGAEFCGLAFDELYRFTESQFLFLTSRNRSTCGVPPYIRATSNPDPGWLRSYLAPWVDPDWKGQRAESEEILWQRRNDKGDLEYVPEGTPYAKSITFIRAELSDNPSLYVERPDYEVTLHNLPRIERARLLYGDWSVVAEGLVYEEAFDPIYNVLVERAPMELRNEGGMDFGINNPFCAVSGLVDHDDVLWVTGERYGNKETITQHAKHLPGGARWHADPAGREQIQQLRNLGHQVYPCTHIPATRADGEKRHPMLAGIDLVKTRMRTGRLKILRWACPNLVRELGLYAYDPKKPGQEEPLDKDNHSCDALRYWVVGHDRWHTKDLSPRQENELERLAREFDVLHAQ